MNSERFRVVTGLPSDGGWRADLALDRSAAPPRPVVLARVPPAMASDATALAALARGADLAGRVAHPAVRRVLGVAEEHGDLVVLEAWREGDSLEWLLRTGGPLSPPLAVRAGVELAAALQAVHALPAAGSRPLAHGDVRAERVVLAEDGAVLLCGLGRPTSGAATPGDDLRALARLLADCLPPGGEGVPPALTAAIERGLAVDGFGTAREFGEAIAAAMPPAPLSALAAKVEAAAPSDRPGRQARRAALEQALRAEVERSPEAGAAPVPPVAREVSPPRPPPVARAAAPDAAPGAPAFPAAAISASPSLARLVEEEAAAAGSSYVEVAKAVEARATSAATPAASARPWVAWLADPRAPLAVGAACGGVGLLLGLLLGGR